MTTALDPQTAKRLAFLRLVYEQGVQQSRLPAPLNATALLFLHDAVELFLVLAGDHLRVQLDRKTNFLDYWDRLKKAPNGVHLSGVAGMRRLNDHRNGLKHAGNMPSPDVLDQVKADVSSFFDDNVPRVFQGLAFDAIDMAEVIPQGPVRRLVREAGERERDGSRSLAMVILNRAFYTLFDGRGVRGFGSTLRKDPWLANNLRSALAQPNDRMRGDKVARQIEDLHKATVDMQEVVRILTLGLDIHEYRRFERLIREFWSHKEERDVEVAQRAEGSGHVPTQEELGFCRQFIVQAAISVFETAEHRKLPSWYAEEFRDF